MKIIDLRNEKDPIAAWSALQHHEIGQILDELQPIMQSSEELKQRLDYFMQLLRGAQRAPDESTRYDLLLKAEARSGHIAELLKDLKKKFKKLPHEMEDIEEMEQYVRDNFLLVEIVNNHGDIRHYHFNKKKSFELGRENTGLGPVRAVSRKHLVLTFHGGKFYCQNTATLPTVMTETKYNAVSTTYFSEDSRYLFRKGAVKQISLNQWYYIIIEDMPPQNRFYFSFRITPFS